MSTNPSTGDGPVLLFHDTKTVHEALGASLRKHSRIPVRGRWFVNSHPKSGTHLLRNILLHFNTPEVYRDLVFEQSLKAALDRAEADQIYMGHVAQAVFAKEPSRPTRTVVLLRHPCAIALALARAFYDVNTTRPDHLYMREHENFEWIVEKVVRGYKCEGVTSGPLAASLKEFALDWLPKVDFVLRFEELRARLKSSDEDLLAYLRPVLEAMFDTVPEDAIQRIRAGGSETISATYSRTASAYDALRPDDVYRLLLTPHARQLRAIAGQLGY
jgi:hypothetical protein